MRRSLASGFRLEVFSFRLFKLHLSPRCQPGLLFPDHNSVTKDLTTVEVATLLGIGRDTLYRWIRAEKIAGPKLTVKGEFQRVVWTDNDVKRFRNFMKQNYQKAKVRKKS